MLTPILAVRTSWIGLLVVLVALAALWFVVRAVIDLIVWFKEEVIDDFRDSRKSRDNRPRGRR
jgi:hypothetical protein